MSRKQQIAIILSSRRKKTKKVFSGKLSKHIKNSNSTDILGSIGLTNTVNWIKDNKGKTILVGVGTLLTIPVIFGMTKAGMRISRVANTKGGGIKWNNMTDAQIDKLFSKVKPGDLFFQGGAPINTSRLVKDISILTGSKIPKYGKRFSEPWRAADRLYDLPVKLVVDVPMPHVSLVVGKVNKKYITKIMAQAKLGNIQAIKVKKTLGFKPEWWIGKPLIAQATTKGRIIISPTQSPIGGKDALGMFVRPKYTSGEVDKLITYVNNLSNYKSTDIKFVKGYKSYTKLLINEFSDPFTKKLIACRFNTKGFYFCSGYIAKFMENSGVAKFNKNLELFTAADLLKNKKVAGSIVGSGKNIDDLYTWNKFTL